MKKIFDNQGALKRIIPGFEYREDQLKMSEFILERLFESENALIEAGTGIGKTLAYIVPVINYALENNRKITITTETKALQKQIIDKDLPIVKKIFNDHLDSDFKFSLCLGSSNYPCRRRFETAVQKGKFKRGEEKSLSRLIALMESKKIISRFDINISNDLWHEINREPDGCNSFRCVFASRCPFQLAKKEWAKSDLLVMNHYLFFSNIASGKTYLPETDAVIFDEAHSVEDIASAQLGFVLGYSQFLEILEKFYRKKKKNTLLNFIDNVEIRGKSLGLIKKISSEASRFFERLRTLFQGKGNSIRIKEELNFGNEFLRMLKEFTQLMGLCEEFFTADDLKLEFDIARGRLFVFTENLASFLFLNNDNYVYWVQRDDRELLGDINLKGQPMNISEILNDQVFSSYKSSIFVSATLSIGGDFSYISKRLGIESGKSLALKSTFDYKKQAVLYAAKDLAEPNNPEFIRRSAEVAAEIINYLKGNCLVLFTAYKMLGEVKKILSGLIDFPIYSQDEFTPGEAMGLYLSGHNSVLMGTHSFWQGIDLSGDLLRGVIMMRLPFSVPDSPMIEAKMEMAARQGLNPFLAFQVPDAAIKFKQGFGRLIRSRSDKGIIAILDSRIITKPYGKYFIKSIPECGMVYTIEEMIKNYEKILMI